MCACLAPLHSACLYRPSKFVRGSQAAVEDGDTALVALDSDHVDPRLAPLLARGYVRSNGMLICQVSIPRPLSRVRS